MRLCHLLLVVSVSTTFALSSSVFAQAVSSLEQVHRLLHADKLPNGAAESLSKFFENRFQEQNLERGTHRHLLQRTDGGGGYVAWCLRAPKDAQVAIVAEKGRRWPMVRLGESDLWAWAEKFDNFTSVHYRFDVNGARLGGGFTHHI